MAIRRQRKYTVSFGFICDGGSLSALAQPQEMKHGDLNFALAMVDPFNHEKWMAQIDSLRRIGDYMTITMTSESDEHGTVCRAVKVERV